MYQNMIYKCMVLFRKDFTVHKANAVSLLQICGDCPSVSLALCLQFLYISCVLQMRGPTLHAL